MTLIVNGEKKEFEKDLTIEEILRSLGVEEKVMAAAVNTKIVKKEEWKRYRPKEGDRVEFLTFVGGG